MTIDASMLPAGWASAAFGRLAGGGQYGWTTKAAEQGDVKFLRTTDITKGAIDWGRVPYCAETPPNIEKYNLHRGDILISRAGSVGFSALMEDVPPSTIFASYLIRFLPDLRIVNPEYLALFLQSPAYWQQVSVASAGIALSNVNATGLTQIEVPVAPLPEQARIAAKVHGLRTRCARVTAVLDTVPLLLDRLRQSILAAAFRGDLTADWRARNPDVENADSLLERIRRSRSSRSLRKASRTEAALLNAEQASTHIIPARWEIARIGDVARLQPGFAFKSEWYRKAGVRLLRGVNISPGATRWEDAVYLDTDRAAEYTEYSLREGDVVIAMDRPLVAAGLKACRVRPADLPALLLQRVGRLLPEAGILPDYLYLFLLSSDFLMHCQKQSTGTQLPHISGNDIESAMMPLPPSDEQAAIVDRVRSILDKFSSAEAAYSVLHDHLRELERAILDKAFRGQLAPQDLSDEPASALIARMVEGVPAASVKHARNSSASALPASPMLPELKAAPARPERSSIATSAAMLAREFAAAASPVQQALHLVAHSDFLDLSAEAQTSYVYRILLGEGPLRREDAVRRAAELLRDSGQASFQRLRRDGSLATCIDAALAVGLRQGHFDRPRPGTVRAVAGEAAQVPPALWRRALLASLVEPVTDDDAAVRAAAAWSQAQFGLEFQRLRTGGHIDTALRGALAELLAAGELTRDRNGTLTLRARPG